MPFPKFTRALHGNAPVGQDVWQVAIRVSGSIPPVAAPAFKG